MQTSGIGMSTLAPKITFSSKSFRLEEVLIWEVGKLSPRYINPFEVFRQVGEVTYELALPPSLSIVHLVFHVSMLKKYVLNSLHGLQNEELNIQPDLSYE